MIYHSFELPRTPFTARAALSSLNPLDLGRLAAEATPDSRRAPRWQSDWQAFVGTDCLTEDPLQPAQIFRVAKLLERPHAAPNAPVLIERFCQIQGDQLIPFKVKYYRGSAKGRFVERHVFHRNMQTIYQTLLFLQQRAGWGHEEPVPFEDPKVTFLTLASPLADDHPGVTEMAEEITSRIKTVSPYGYDRISPDLYTLPGIEAGMAPFVQSFIGQVMARQNNRAAVWTPQQMDAWVRESFGTVLPVVDPLTGRSLSGGFTMNHLGTRMGSLPGFDSRAVAALEIPDYDKIEVAPDDLREFAQLLDEHPVTDFVVALELDEISGLAGAIQPLVWHDRYAAVWGLSEAGRQWELQRLAQPLLHAALGLYRADVFRRRHPGQGRKVRLTKTFNDEALLELFDAHGRLVHGAYFDFTRLSLGSLGMTSQDPW